MAARKQDWSPKGGVPQWAVTALNGAMVGYARSTSAAARVILEHFRKLGIRPVGAEFEPAERYGQPAVRVAFKDYMGRTHWDTFHLVSSWTARALDESRHQDLLKDLEAQLSEADDR